jgi:hypothetical protein
MKQKFAEEGDPSMTGAFGNNFRSESPEAEDESIEKTART